MTFTYIHTHTHTHTRTQSQVQEVSCFSHRAKVGCSRLAVVLMTHHFLSFCRKNDAWDALPELPPSSLPGCVERTRTSVTVTKTAVTVWQLPGALKTLPHSLLRATPYEEGVTTIPTISIWEWRPCQSSFTGPKGVGVTGLLSHLFQAGWAETY